MQPLLGSVGSLLVVPDVGLQVSYPVFSGAELSGKLMSHSESLLVLGLDIGGYAMKQPENGLGCPVNWIVSFWLGVRFWRELNDCFCRN
jgi:hypothetical protein